MKNNKNTTSRAPNTQRAVYPHSGRADHVIIFITLIFVVLFRLKVSVDADAKPD